MPAAVVITPRLNGIQDLNVGSGTFVANVLGLGAATLDKINASNLGVSIEKGDLTGTKDGVNTAFTIPSYRTTNLYVLILLNGVIQKAAKSFNRTGAAVTALAGYIPQSTDDYEYLIFYYA